LSLHPKVEKSKNEKKVSKRILQLRKKSSFEMKKRMN
jgi:hypothetical protein